MARVTVEDCLDNVKNRFELVMIASKRARQLANGREPLVEADNDKPTVLALREISEGKIGVEIFDEVSAASHAGTSITSEDEASKEMSAE